MIYDDIIDGIHGAMTYMVNSETKIKNEIFNLGNDYPIKHMIFLKPFNKN